MSANIAVILVLYRRHSAEMVVAETCTDLVVVHMLAEEADDWWVSTQPILRNEGAVITWAVFRREFLRRYFPENVRGKKEIEFLELKQNMLQSLWSLPSSIHTMLRRLLSSPNVSSLKMVCELILSGTLVIRR